MHGTPLSVVAAWGRGTSAIDCGGEHEGRGACGEQIGVGGGVRCGGQAGHCSRSNAIKPVVELVELGCPHHIPLLLFFLQLVIVFMPS